MAVPATGGALAGAIFQQAVDFGEYYVAQGNTDVNHIATSAQIKDYLSDSKKIALLKSLVRANPWKNLPFVKGDDTSGYWINQEELKKYQENFYQSRKILLIISIILIAIGFIGYFILYHSLPPL